MAKPVHKLAPHGRAPTEREEPQPFEVTGVVPLVIVDPPALPTAGLVCVIGDQLGRTFRLGTAPVVIGRGAVDIVLAATDVSRRHAQLICDGDSFVLEDLSSANGTFHNGTRVDRVALRVGDRIQIGGSIFLFAQHDELEERMRRLQRLETMGSLAGGLAHDFNNTLAVIMGELEIVEAAIALDASDAQEALESIRQATTSAIAVAKRLMRLGRTDDLQFERVSLSHLVEKLVAIMRRQHGASIAIATKVQPDLVVRGSPEELHQSLLNLFVNARDAMPGGGTVVVEARAVYCDARTAMARNLPAAGHYVELAIADTGCGMDEATLSRAFEPFFTTKLGKGNGLGLAMIHGSVRRHGGAIEVESVVGVGTTFRLLLQQERDEQG